ncbi:phenylacetaldoxime dehydratase family protein [Sphingobium sp. AS12]|uniref:phenylacetaldoxime dehydratase family protein n=1 Tax=Sphingobium sp. AS12 TaxID=2849495 RepID=UPI001C317B19|nr:phenylacetaldoxime dehydratase family protein [Sphingobium sp. AS12]MBV2150134.1 phenylacetaldoxime dehydratase family protein [Sphingobium sp. AS12]
MLPKGRPENWEPPHDAFTSVFPEDWPEVAISAIGVQIAPGGDGAGLVQALAALFTSDGGPLHVEQSEAQERFGFKETLFFAYWRSPEQFRQWTDQAAVRALFGQPLTGLVGLWSETSCAATELIDPNYSMDGVRWGFSRYVPRKLEKEHFYYGSMRRRMAGRARLPGASAGAGFAVTRNGSVIEGVSKDHSCTIRSVVGLSLCSPAQRRDFIDGVYPAYARAADYLARSRAESGCFSARLCTEVHGAIDAGIDSSFLGYFASLDALEAWVHNHPTHDDIIASALSVLQRHQFQMPINLGHEVLVSRPGGLHLVYNNCHAETGLLPLLNETSGT